MQRRCIGIIMNKEKITEKLNEVYDDDYYEEFEPIA
jgi:hypothetical protein